MTLEELKKLIADDEGETVKQAGTGPARPLKNGLPQPPLLFPAEYAIISAFSGVDLRSAGRV